MGRSEGRGEARARAMTISRLVSDRIRTLAAGNSLFTGTLAWLSAVARESEVKLASVALGVAALGSTGAGRSAGNDLFISFPQGSSTTRRVVAAQLSRRKTRVENISKCRFVERYLRGPWALAAPRTEGSKGV